MPATPAELKNTLADRMKKFLDDVVSLDVVTLSGDITLKNADTRPATNQEEALNWSEIFKKITSGMVATDDSKLEVVAYTRAEWDCDSINYVKKGASDAELRLIENHQRAVEAAHRSRYEALQFISKAVSTLG